MQNTQLFEEWQCIGLPGLPFAEPAADTERPMEFHPDSDQDIEPPEPAKVPRRPRFPHLVPCCQCSDARDKWLRPDCRCCGGTGKMHGVYPDAKTAKGLAAAAKKMILQNRVNCRPFDACFESGNGDKVEAILIREVRDDPHGDLAVAVRRNSRWMNRPLMEAAEVK